MKIAARCALLVIIIIVITASPVNVFSCGPFFPQAVFVFHHQPDMSQETFLRGDIGIVQPGFSSIYLFIAYRYLSGRDLSSDEQKFISAINPPDSIRDSLSSAHDDWMSSRQKVLGSNPYSYFWPSNYFSDKIRNLFEFYENIHCDAYETAANTLDDLINQFGVQNPYVVDWVHAQDMVFEAADSGKAPSPVDASAPPIFHADRDYQIAAAHFYMRDYSVAESLFALIARDDSSPWQKTSRFLIARSMIREATLLSSNEDSLLTLVEGYLDSLLKDPAMEEFHPAARRLVNFCNYRTDPEDLFEELDHRINAPRIEANFSAEWHDYANLLGQFADTSFEGKSDFAAWNTCYLGREDSAAFAKAYGYWRKTNSSAWLIAALSDAGPMTPGLQSLLDAAAAMSPEERGYATATYWRTHLLIEERQNKQAMKLVDTLLAYETVKASISSTNLVLLERTRLVNDFNEFLRYCYQKPCGIYQEDEAGCTIKTDTLQLFTAPAAIMNKYVPLTLLDSACHGTLLPPNLRAELLRATWTRSFLLRRENITLGLGSLLTALNPELKPFIDQYDSAKDEGSRQFTGAYILLKFPGLQPAIRIGEGRLSELGDEDDFRDNWWYPEDLEYVAKARSIYMRGCYFNGDEEPDSVQPPDFISKEDQREGETEVEDLYSLPVAATYLAGIVNSWSKAHPEDPRVPEALHRVVEVCRVGCSDPSSQGGEKEAFNILHKRYPDSEWTERTKYWY